MFNRDELKLIHPQLHQASEHPFQVCPISLKFITRHYSSGEMYMEFIKCIENKCCFCIGSPCRSPTLKGVPRPMPDVSKLPSYHYLDVFHTQLVDSNKLRSPDDFMPNAVVKKLFKEGELQNMEDIKTFANQYVVKAEMVIYKTSTKY